jgi:hypothetical protein
VKLHAGRAWDLVATGRPPQGARAGNHSLYLVWIHTPNVAAVQGSDKPEGDMCNLKCQNRRGAAGDFLWPRFDTLTAGSTFITRPAGNLLSTTDWWRV